MKTQVVGIFEYQERFSDIKQEKLPTTMQLSSATNEALLLRILLGQINLKKNTSPALLKSFTNYSYLPFSTSSIKTFKAISDIFSNGEKRIDVIINKNQINNYFTRNRQNHFVHRMVLFEISCFFANQSTSPIAAFAHLYRCLEYVSYSFPMIYASKSRDYTGTYNNLKKFFSGDKNDNGGELKFFKNFLSVLFEDEKAILKYVFDIDIILSGPTINLEKDCKTVYTGIPNAFERGLLQIEFINMLDYFITTRNRFFHLCIGQNHKNFCSVDYDISEYFRSLNPHILNWLTVIIMKISTYGFYLSL